MVSDLYKKKKVLAVIPSRKGSKGLKKKNIKLINGKPLVEWTIKLSNKIKLFDNIVISSDCEETREISKNYHCDFIKRPKLISNSRATTDSVLIHVLKVLKNKNFDFIVTLEPTSPLRKIETIMKCIKRAIDKNYNSLITIKSNKELIGKIDGDYFRPVINKNFRRRQDRNIFFSETGVAYITKVDFLKKHKKMISNDTGFIVVDTVESIDINNIFDFIFVESLMKKKIET